MKATHTPGPWKVSENGCDIETAHKDSPTGICTMFAYEKSDADAAIIAAAPELLEALEALTKWVTMNTGAIPGELLNANTIIAKAKGGK